MVRQACPLRVNGYRRSGVGALDVDVVVRAVVQLQEAEVKNEQGLQQGDNCTVTKSLTSLRLTAFCLAVSYTGVSVTTE